MTPAVAPLPRRWPAGAAASVGRGTYATLALLAGLVLGTAAMGRLGLAPARMFFIGGCLLVGYRAYRTGGLPLHAAVGVSLFAFAPFLRRIVDVHVGYDPAGVMLVGPLAAIAVVLPELRAVLAPGRKAGAMLLPFAVMLCCIVYGWMLSAFAGTLVGSTVVAIKYAIPMLYGMCILLNPDQGEAVLVAVARCFMIVGPILGLYGIWQELQPQDWDRYWMVASQIPSIGLPVPGQVRVFSMMNSPVSFAVYATVGLLLLGFAPRWFMPPLLLVPVAMMPLCVAILLSSVRAAWMMACASILFCLLFGRTRGRSALIVGCAVVGIAYALSYTSFGDSIAARFDTLSGNVSDDGSGHERLGDYMHVFSGDDRYILGTGFVPVDGDQQLAALDGQVLMSTVEMGTTIGMVFVMAIVYAGIQAVARVKWARNRLQVAVAGLIAGALVIIPLTAVAVGEIGVLFWMLVGAMGSARPAPAIRAGA